MFGLIVIKEFDVWMEKMGFFKDGKLIELVGDVFVLLG